MEDNDFIFSKVESLVTSLPLFHYMQVPHRALLHHNQPVHALESSNVWLL